MKVFVVWCIALTLFAGCKMRSSVSRTERQESDKTPLLIGFGMQFTAEQMHKSMKALGYQPDDYSMIEAIKVVKVLKADSGTLRASSAPQEALGLEFIEQPGDFHFPLAEVEVVPAALPLTAPACSLPYNDPFLCTHYGLAQIEAFFTWPHVSDAEPIVVAVLDTGIDFDHPEFEGKIVAGKNYLVPENPP